LIEFLKWSSAGFFTVQLFRSHKSASDAFSRKKNECKKEKLNITFNQIKNIQVLTQMAWDCWGKGDRK
jgi:hypothetical protein